MRSRRPTLSTSIDVSKPIEIVVEELNSHLDRKSVHSIGDRIECLKSFLVRFKFHFNQALSANHRILLNETDESAQQKNLSIKSDEIFERELENKCDCLSIGLVYSIIQMESSQVRLLSLQIILYLSHLSVFAQRFHELNINLYIVRLIDLELSWDETSLCLEYIRLLNQLWPKHLDKSIVYCLLSALEDSRFKLNYLILETLLEIVCQVPGFVFVFLR